MARFGRSTVPIAGAAVLALVALAAFLILDFGSGSVDVSSLPVIQIDQTGTSQSGQGSGQTGHRWQGPGGTTGAQSTTTTASTASGTAGTQPAPGNGSSTTATGSATTGSTVREAVNGRVHMGTTGGSPGGGSSTDSSSSTSGGGTSSTEMGGSSSVPGDQ